MGFVSKIEGAARERENGRFVDAVANGHAPAVGIHEAMDMTLPGLISQQSIAEGGKWLDVPDSREW